MELNQPDEVNQPDKAEIGRPSPMHIMIGIAIFALIGGLIVLFFSGLSLQSP
jgi:hypothetical protein